MNRVLALFLALSVALPTAVPAAKGAACAMKTPPATAACGYCAPATPTASAVPSLQAGCCRFAPKPESVPAQAGSVSATPKPVQAPDLAAVLPQSAGLLVVAAASRAHEALGGSPPHAPPTRTTHLLI